MEMLLRGMIGTSSAFVRLKSRILRAAQFDVPVLIEGETGTGKDLAARALHYNSPRSDRPFVPVNCGALPETLIENEFFGHRRGAFTHAATDASGLLHLAEGGTLFLDEIDSLPPKGQVMLLRLLEDAVYRPLGAQREVRFDVRMVAASNQNLDDLVRQGRFRADLLFRLRLIELRIPPLREREDDAEQLAEHFVGSMAARHRLQARPLHACTRAWIRRHDWPGNVRELQHWICRALLLGDGTEELLPAPDDDRAAPAPATADSLRYRDARARALELFDRSYLQELIGRHHGNITHAAHEAGKERRALARLLKRYAIDAAGMRAGQR